MHKNHCNATLNNQCSYCKMTALNAICNTNVYTESVCNILDIYLSTDILSANVIVVTPLRFACKWWSSRLATAPIQASHSRSDRDWIRYLLLTSCSHADWNVFEYKMWNTLWRLLKKKRNSNVNAYFIIVIKRIHVECARDNNHEFFCVIWHGISICGNIANRNVRRFYENRNQINACWSKVYFAQ